jgi:hypothetical protein
MHGRQDCPDRLCGAYIPWLTLLAEGHENGGEKAVRPISCTVKQL